MISEAQFEHRRIAERAAMWLLTVQSEQLSASQRADFIDWLRESPLHIAEMLRICRLQRALADFKGWDQIAPMDVGQPSAFVEFLESRNLAAPVGLPSHRVRYMMLMAASIAALGLLGILVFARFDQTVLRTQLGERREMTLGDGSVVDLAPDSEVVVRYRARERLIALNHGEALFHVARNPNRPFIVQAALTSVRAVGTVFNVGRDVHGVSITVVEGRVSVSQRSASNVADVPAESCAAALCLGADEQVSISPAGRATAVRKVRSDAAIGWAAGRLAFENETVAEIARRFNLYNRTQIQVLDAGLAGRRISGMFQASDPESFVAFVQAVAGAQVVQRDSNHIALGSPAQSSSGDTAP
jgi:transmembrane sensor